MLKEKRTSSFLLHSHQRAEYQPHDGIYVMIMFFYIYSAVNALPSILVTGGAGFIGQHLINKLASTDYNIVVLDHVNTSISPRIKFYAGDIRNSSLVREILKREQIEICVHLAARLSTSGYESDAYSLIDVNINGTLSMLQTCTEQKVRKFVFASSAAVYGEQGPIPLQEDHVVQPLSIYGASKAAGEALVSAFSNTNKIANAVSLRFFNVYGEKQNPTYAGVISHFASRLSLGLPPIINGNGQQTRDFISVEDVVNAILLATKAEDLRGSFNVGTGVTTSILALAEKMIRLFGLDINPIYRQGPLMEIVHSCADTKKTREFLQFTSNVNIDSGLKALINKLLQKDSPQIRRDQ